MIYAGFSTISQDTLNYLTPDTGKFTSIVQPDTLIAAPVGLPLAGNLAIHYVAQENSIWFTELLRNRIGRYQLD